MARRKRWKAPNNPTPIARQVWRACYPERPWPKGWRVLWVGWMNGARGLCDHATKRILLSHGDAKKRDGDIVRTLIHEFVHVNNYGLKHGIEFDRLTLQACRRVGIDTLDWNGSKRALAKRSQPTLEAA